MIFDFIGGYKHLEHSFKVAGNTLNTEISDKKPLCGGCAHLKQRFFNLLRWLYLPPLKNLPRAPACTALQYHEREAICFAPIN